MINPVKSFLTHGPLKLKEIYTNKQTHVTLSEPIDAEAGLNIPLCLNL